MTNSTQVESAEHMLIVPVSEGAARAVPALTRAGRAADYVTVDTRQRLPAEGTVMAAEMLEVDDSTFTILGRVSRPRRGRIFTIRGVELAADAPEWVGTVTGAYWNLRS